MGGINETPNVRRHQFNLLKFHPSLLQLHSQRGLEISELNSENVIIIFND
jgi:hypothetical protein